MRNTPKKNECRDHLGNKYPNKSAMCNAWGVSLALYIKRMQRHDNNIRYALTGILYTDPRDPKVGYASVAKMCAAYGIPVAVYKQRKQLGWTDEDALTTPLKTAAARPVSHKITLDGIEYPSIRAACLAYDIKSPTYYARVRNGWQLPDAITTPTRHNRRPNP